MKRAPIQLSLTPKELRTLVEMAFLCESVVGGDPKSANPKFNKAVEALAEKIYGCAIESKVPTDVAFDDESGTYITDGMMVDSDAAKLLRAYDKDTFQDLLVRELVLRAAIREATERKWKKMPIEEKLALSGYHEDRIVRAFDKYGLDAIYVMAPESAE